MFSFDLCTPHIGSPHTCVPMTHTNKINNNNFKKSLQNFCFELSDNQAVVARVHPCVDLSGSIQTHRTNKVV
jgi:hypothetical protein